MFEQLDVLKRSSDSKRRDLVWPQSGNVLTFKNDLPRCRLVEPRDQVKDRGLTCAVRPDDGEHLARLDGEADAIDRSDAAELYREIGNFEQAHRTRSVLR